ncbi:MAG: IPT/TIG domain-containing protein [Acidimicrobiales bacterium]
MSHSHGSSGRTRVYGLGSIPRLSVRRSIPRLAASALAAAALLSGLAVVGLAGVASAIPPRIILYATPRGTATSVCTSATTNPCSLSGAIGVAGSSTYYDDAVTIDLEHSTGAPCSASDPCTFSGTQSVANGSEASLTIEGTATGSDSSAYSVLDARGSGTTFTDGATSHFPVTLSNVTVTGGNATGGGGIVNNGTMTVVDSTISDNSTAGYGGGIFDGFVMTVVDSTVSGNSAGIAGGGIANAGGNPFPMTVVDSTISGNTTDGGGGGILNAGHDMIVVDSTISGNTSYPGPAGGAIENYGGGTTLAGSIVADQAAGDYNCSYSPITDAGYNLSSDTSCGFGSGTASHVSATIDLGTLGNYGGPTQTIPLLGTPSTDQAIGAITSPATAGPALSSVELCSDTSYTTASGYVAKLSYDQRGVARPATGCDAGASQYVAPPPAPVPPAPVVTSVSPASGPLGGGTSVTITGQNLFNAA